MGPAGAPYVTRAQLSQYMPPAVLSLVTDAVLDQACLDATEEADSYLRGRYSLPLLAWGKDIVRYTAMIAVYLVAKRVGFAPQGNSDKAIVEDYYRAVGWPDRAGTGWFPGIQRQAIHPDVTPTINPVNDPTTGLPQIQTAQLRGWQQTRNGKPVIG